MLVIKDMELPKSCLLCPLIDNDGWYSCDIKPEARVVIEYDQRANDCPLVEIATCKDCEHWEKRLSPQTPTNKEYHFCPMIDMYTSYDFFCKDGERREK
jgi:hypothetical protein